MTHDHRVTQYLEAIARLCLETSRNPALLPVFVQLVAMVPATIVSLRREQKRLAA
jgi:hypothetical protein